MAVFDGHWLDAHALQHRVAGNEGPRKTKLLVSTPAMSLPISEASEQTILARIFHTPIGRYL